MLLLAVTPANGAVVQTPVDQADPSLIEDELRSPEAKKAKDHGRTVIEQGNASKVTSMRPVLVGAIRIDGASAVAPADFAPIIDRYVGRELAAPELSRLASEIAGVAREHGYGFATAWIPQQEISNGVLRVTLDEGRIDEIRATGSAASSVGRLLAPLVNGMPVRTVQLERRLLLAEDLAGVRLGKARLDRSKGRNVLMVKGTHDPIEARAVIDNWGSDTVGPVRAQLSIDFNGLIASGDRLTLGGMVTPLEPRELALGRAAYTTALGGGGTELTVEGYLARTRPGGALRDQDIKGRSAFGSVGISHPVMRSRSASIWAYGDLGLLDTTQTRAGALFRDDRIVTLRASLYGTTSGSHGRLRVRLGAVRGLDLFDATQSAQPRKSRADGSAIFSKLEFWAAYDVKLGANFSLALQSEGQLASRPLLASQEMGLGGRFFLRGYDYREHSGDKGAAGSAELRFDLKALPKPINSAQLYLYADAGQVANHRGGFGSGSLASAGAGVRVRVADRFDAGLELGVPLRRGNAGASYDPRISFTLATRF